jgi:hypothetical protein
MTRHRIALCALVTLILGLPGSRLPAQSEKLLEVEQLAFYQASAEVSLVAAVPVFTIQAPAGSSKAAYLRNAQLYSSVDATIQMEKNGTAATATTITAVPLNSNGTPIATSYKSSDVGAGSALAKVELKAGIPQPIDLSWSTFPRNSDTVQNFTFRGTSAITGTFRFSIIWGQK